MFHIIWDNSTSNTLHCKQLKQTRLIVVVIRLVVVFFRLVVVIILLEVFHELDELLYLLHGDSVVQGDA